MPHSLLCTTTITRPWGGCGQTVYQSTATAWADCHGCVLETHQDNPYGMWGGSNLEVRILSFTIHYSLSLSPQGKDALDWAPVETRQPAFSISPHSQDPPFQLVREAGTAALRPQRAIGSKITLPPNFPLWCKSRRPPLHPVQEIFTQRKDLPLTHFTRCTALRRIPRDRRSHDDDRVRG